MIVSHWFLLGIWNISEKFVENIKAHILLLIILFLRNSCRLWDNVEKYGRIRHATDGNIIQRMRFLSRITEAGIKTHEYNNYVYWTLHHLDSWIKRDQLDVTCFFISLFNAQHVSDVNTSILRSLRLICWVVSWVVLLWYDVCWCYVVVWLGWCGIRMKAFKLNVVSCSQQTWNYWDGYKRIKLTIVINVKLIISPRGGDCECLPRGTKNLAVPLRKDTDQTPEKEILEHLHTLDPYSVTAV